MAEPLPTPSPAALCQNCDQPGKYHCTRCQTAHYCSEQCQKADYPTHRILCANYAETVASHRPSPEHFLAIHLPATGAPKFVWAGPSPKTANYADTTAFLGERKKRAMRLLYNDVLRRDIDRKLYLTYCDDDGSAAAEVNETARRIRDLVPDNSDGRATGWKGGMLFHGSDAGWARRDVDLEDFRHVVDFLATWPRNPPGSGE